MDETKDAKGWMSDVQRALALLLIGSVAFMIAAFTLRIILSGDPAVIGPLLKELKDALINMSLIALGFFFGSSQGSQAKDQVQAKAIENLTATGTGNGAPAAVTAAAVAAAPAAAAMAAPAAAAAAAPPAAEEAAPPAVSAELDERGFIKPKE